MIAGAKRVFGTAASALGKLVEDGVAPAATRAAERVPGGFRPPVRLDDGRFGYPLSPREPMRLPEDVYDAAEAGQAVMPALDDTLSDSDDELLALANDWPVAAAEPAAADAAAGQAAGAFFFNRRGMIERRDIDAVYRAESTSRIQQRDPLVFGFRSAEGAESSAPLLESPELITYDTLPSATAVAEREYGAGNYQLYRIDARSLRAVSIRENQEFNPEYVALMQERGRLADEMSVQRIEELFGDLMSPEQLAMRGDPRFDTMARDLARRGLGVTRDAAEVHIDNWHLTHDTVLGGRQRITLLPGGA